MVMYSQEARGQPSFASRSSMVMVLLLFYTGLQTCSAFTLSHLSGFKHSPTSGGRAGLREVAASTCCRYDLHENAGRSKAITPLCAATTGFEARQEEQQEEMPASEDQEKKFQWNRQWYPVAVMRDLEARDPRQPYPVQLMGEALVVWKDPKGGWQAFADRCPHRWAPLSEGRVNQDTGRLHCIYHGWEFEGDGRCGTIPQANAAVLDNARGSKRACATVIPSKVMQDLLWLWPDSSPEGVKASETVSPVVVPDLNTGEFGGQWYARDLPYGFDTLVENLVDASHIPFAHHGTIAFRQMAQPMDIAIDEDYEGENGFVTNKTGYIGMDKLFEIGFEAPGRTVYWSDYSGVLPSYIAAAPKPIKALAWIVKTFNLDRRMTMKEEDRKEYDDKPLNIFITWAVPTAPGKSRIFTRSARNFFLQHPVIPRRWRNSIAKEHLDQHLVLDGDSTALFMQERFLADADEKGVAQPEKTYYMPTDADTPVRAFRKWYNTKGDGGPTWAKGSEASAPGPILPREKMLDRMDTHTKDCSACSKAHRVSRKLKRASAGGVVLLLAAAAAAPRGLLPLGLCGGALANAGLALAMAKRQQQFEFLDYVHYDRD